MRRRQLLLLALALLLILAAWWISSQSPPIVLPDGAQESAATTPDAAPTRLPDAAPEVSKEPRGRRRVVQTGETTEDDTATPAEKQRFSVRVLGPQDRPLPGVEFRHRGNAGVEVRHTGSDGRAHFDVEGGVEEGVEELLVETLLRDGDDPLRLTAEETVIHLDGLLPLTVAFVDLESGLPVPVRVHEPIFAAGPTGAPQDRLFAHEAPLRRGRIVGFSIHFDVLTGYVHPGAAAVSRAGHVSLYAQSAAVTIPVPRELLARVRVLRHDGRPAAAATVSARVSGGAAGTRGVTDRDGEVAVGGLPFLRGERFSATATGKNGVTAARVVLLEDADTAVLAEITLPERQDTAIGIGGGASGAFSGRSGRRTLRTGQGRVDATVSRRNGLPAAHALVRLDGPLQYTARADEQGHVSFGHLPPGEYTLTLREPGLVATSQTVTVGDRATVTISLTEVPGRDGVVLVVDEAGRPVPHARLTVRLPWHDTHVQLVDGVQLLDLFTDAYGRCELIGLPAAPVTVLASFGSRTASGSLEGDALELTLK